LSITNFLTIDVEDYFHVSAFEKISPPSSWENRELRVERNTDLVLSVLNDYGVTATFFVLGWVAERCPELVRRIAAEGHEVASHGYLHQLVVLMDRLTYRDDIRSSKSILEELTGAEVIGYRAPSYSITRDTDWAFDELLEAGYRYDSSIFPMKHDFYGIPDWPRFAGYAVKTKNGWIDSSTPTEKGLYIRELPITTLRFAGKNLPIAGGGYFRLLPYALTRWGLKTINREDCQTFVFYLHPWEFDPLQPRMTGSNLKSRFRHNVNLNKTEARFNKLLRDFSFKPIHDRTRSEKFCC